MGGGQPASRITWWRKPLTPLKPPETAGWAQEVMGMAPCLPSSLALLYPEMAPPRDTQELASKRSSPMRLRSNVDSPSERASAWASWWAAPRSGQVQTPSTRMDAGVLRRCGASPYASGPTAPHLCLVGGILSNPTGCARHPPDGALLPSLSEEPLG